VSILEGGDDLPKFMRETNDAIDRLLESLWREGIGPVRALEKAADKWGGWNGEPKCAYYFYKGELLDSSPAQP
jgi:hypothetical protein